eukprot:maker-scaffold25_size650667-snap-gene-5.34 protein:Tk06715 transcript:maker-scaffold25_size650667-snap-gene-5.34-mRNA-1 annotation:"peroxisomal membrane protein 2"
MSDTISIFHPIYDLLGLYTKLLREKPLLTKAVTSGVISMLGNSLSQLIKARSSKSNNFELDTRALRAFGILGFGVIAPLTHYFFQLLEQVAPPNSEYVRLKRIILERMILAPLATLGSVVTLDLCQGNFDWEDTCAKLQPVFIGNWKFWTIPQFFNVNFVPLQYRVLFANVFALFWNIYLSFAMAKKKALSD